MGQSVQCVVKHKNFLILNLVKDHRDILLDLMKIKNSIFDKRTPDFSCLETSLGKHLNFENTIFYNRLDQDLSEEDKRFIIGEIF